MILANKQKSNIYSGKLSSTELRLLSEMERKYIVIDRFSVLVRFKDTTTVILKQYPRNTLRNGAKHFLKDNITK